MKWKFINNRGFEPRRIVHCNSLCDRLGTKCNIAVNRWYDFCYEIFLSVRWSKTVCDAIVLVMSVCKLYKVRVVLLGEEDSIFEAHFGLKSKGILSHYLINWMKTNNHDLFVNYLVKSLVGLDDVTV